VSWRRAVPWLLVVVISAAAGLAVLDGGGERRPPAALGPNVALGTRVVEVVDGDTVKVALDGRRERVRYIGVDTPESRRPGTPVECFAKAATAYNRRLVGGQAVTVRTDVEPRDRYGRLLAYVYRRRDGLFVNAALVREGYATVLTIPPNVAHAEEFVRLQRLARQARRGLWHICE
jgi:micrococcal nuclease